uniref:Nucleotide-diphospho-sugar transferase domain-containing protein n=1 Tax=Chromera velia CCMP2878 TaxID=1169474 RepID=A0A0G4IAT2_9ALVE|eukprot:Cvel_12658.t1-p1 / transcript=Cvel_12658.t1 / gene=Cvel_12658 / organism=Chromera_velia_CCMP2878 / gene_product=hypothetical protein / transcript_product=hypothetical protein / location=Cvel_scaffold836:29754-39509(-) / protein_length=559 / sequence_SO=supercontig / SO=protein_coding / is_pseudo=false
MKLRPKGSAAWFWFAIFLIGLYVFCRSMALMFSMRADARRSLPFDDRPFAGLDETLLLRDQLLPHEAPSPDGDTSILICARSNDFASLAAAVWRIRRVLMSTLPIQLWALSASEHQWKDTERSWLRRNSVSFHDVETVSSGRWSEHVMPRVVSNGDKGFTCKIAAVYYTPSRHVMLMDTDVTLMKPPSHFFSLPCYTQHGFVFNRDRPWFVPRHVCEFAKFIGEGYPGPQANWHGSLVELCDRGDFMDSVQCASVVLIDRWRNSGMVGILPTVLLQGQQRYDAHGRYRKCVEPSCPALMGDKDTYWIAAHAAHRQKIRCEGQRRLRADENVEPECKGSIAAHPPCFLPEQMAIRFHNDRLGSLEYWMMWFSGHYRPEANLFMNATEKGQRTPLYIHHGQEEVKLRSDFQQAFFNGTGQVVIQHDGGASRSVCNFFGLDQKRGCLDIGMTREFGPVVTETIMRSLEEERTAVEEAAQEEVGSKGMEKGVGGEAAVSLKTTVPPLTGEFVEMSTRGVVGGGFLSAKRPEEDPPPSVHDEGGGRRLLLGFQEDSWESFHPPR